MAQDRATGSPTAPQTGTAIAEAGRPRRLVDPCRLFLALWPSADEQAQLLAYLRQWSWPAGSAPVRADRLHLTLHFIGSVERRRLAELRTGLRVPLNPFELGLTRPESWPRGLIVLRAAPLTEPLQQLHASLSEALHSLGLPPETRRFRPHVTLARRAAGAIPPLATPDLDWRIDSYALVESLPGAADGYRIRQHYA